MADTPEDVELDYAYLTQDALRGVVREVLAMTRALGMPPGEHHFYIEFATTAPGVSIPDHLKSQYPQRMTIVLQHQFEGLEVDDEGFAVTLHFGGTPAHLVIPFAAVTQFADPSASFALQFAAPMNLGEGGGNDTKTRTEASPLRLASEDGHETRKPAADAPEGDDDPDDTPPTGDGGGKTGGEKSGGADVVSLDRFRKK